MLLFCTEVQQTNHYTMGDIVSKDDEKPKEPGEEVKETQDGRPDDKNKELKKDSTKAEDGGNLNLGYLTEDEFSELESIIVEDFNPEVIEAEVPDADDPDRHLEKVLDALEAETEIDKNVAFSDPSDTESEEQEEPPKSPTLLQISEKESDLPPTSMKMKIADFLKRDWAAEWKSAAERFTQKQKEAREANQPKLFNVLMSSGLKGQLARFSKEKTSDQIAEPKITTTSTPGGETEQENEPETQNAQNVTNGDLQEESPGNTKGERLGSL